jgi:hypothetical protein
MYSISPFIHDPDGLRKLANFYLVAFWAGVALFYISLIDAGYDPRLGLITITSAAIGCALLRMAKRVSPAVKVKPKQDKGLLSSIEDLITEARSRGGQVGVMLVGVRGIDEGNQEARSAGLVTRVRDELIQRAGTRVFDVDSVTLGVAICNPDAALDLYKLSTDLQSEFRVRRPTAPWSPIIRLTVGVAVSENSKVSANDLFENARSSVGLAEARGRDFHVRHI